MTNDRFLRALRCEPVDCTPVWLMRQAGRYLPEYRATRAQAGNFMALCSNPELACEVTLQPLRRFALDAAILFSDILTIPDAMGLGLHFAEGEGPKFRNPLRSAADIERLPIPDPETELRYVMDAVRTIRRELDGRVPLIGFSGSPWTLACYMVQGEGSSNFPLPKALLWNEPALMHQLLDKIARSVTSYLAAQAAAGAQALMVFDTWGGLLAPAQYREFSLRYLAQVTQALKSDPNTRDVPLILFSKGANGHLPALAATGCNGLGVDWTLDLSSARALVGPHIALQGNLDPAALHASPAAIRQEVARVLASHGPGPGHIFNLGHGITPDINPEHVAALVDAVHDLSRRDQPIG
jgi:uroporphyrinogen decarboxylase